MVDRRRRRERSKLSRKYLKGGDVLRRPSRTALDAMRFKPGLLFCLTSAALLNHVHGIGAYSAKDIIKFWQHHLHKAMSLPIVSLFVVLRLVTELSEGSASSGIDQVEHEIPPVARPGLSFSIRNRAPHLIR
jgi:hypothetical protein